MDVFNRHQHHHPANHVNRLYSNLQVLQVLWALKYPLVQPKP